MLLKLFVSLLILVLSIYSFFDIYKKCPVDGGTAQDDKLNPSNKIEVKAASNVGYTGPTSSEPAWIETFGNQGPQCSSSGSGGYKTTTWTFTLDRNSIDSDVITSDDGGQTNKVSLCFLFGMEGKVDINDNNQDDPSDQLLSWVEILLEITIDMTADYEVTHKTEVMEKVNKGPFGENFGLVEANFCSNHYDINEELIPIVQDDFLCFTVCPDPDDGGQIVSQLLSATAMGQTDNGNKDVFQALISASTTADITSMTQQGTCYKVETVLHEGLYPKTPSATYDVKISGTAVLAANSRRHLRSLEDQKEKLSEFDIIVQLEALPDNSSAPGMFGSNALGIASLAAAVVLI